MADGVRAAEEQAMNGGPEFWESQVSHLLAQVDNIERKMLGRRPTTCELRRLGQVVVKRARDNSYLRRELGITRRQLDGEAGM